jgi:hypothetical protein
MVRNIIPFSCINKYYILFYNFSFIEENFPSSNSAHFCVIFLKLTTVAQNSNVLTAECITVLLLLFRFQ